MTYKLIDLLKDSTYKLTQFSVQHIQKLEARVTQKEAELRKAFDSLPFVALGSDSSSLTAQGRVSWCAGVGTQWRGTATLHSHRPYAWPAWLSAAGVPGQQPASNLNFEQMYFALQAAAEGLGLVLVPLFLVTDDIIKGQLCAPFGSLGAMQRRYYTNVPMCAEPAPLVGDFSDWLLREGRDTEAAIGQWARSMGW